MELSKKEKRAVRELGDAVNVAIEQSEAVATAIENLRQMGFEPNLNLKLEISLQEILELSKDSSDKVDLELTDDDLRTLNRMKIAIDD